MDASNRLRTRYDIGTKQVLLQINDLRPDDVGEYKVVATNPAGQASTQCKLGIIPDRRGVDNTPFIEPERFLNLRPIPSKDRPENESNEPKRPPKVIVPLVDIDMEEQMPVVFVTTIDAGVPMASVCVCNYFQTYFSKCTYCFSLIGSKMDNLYAIVIVSRRNMIFLIEC